MRGGAEVARWAHNPKVTGSSPVPATKESSEFSGDFNFKEDAFRLLFIQPEIPENLCGQNFKL